MADEGGQKTEQPTEKKLQGARRKGQVWKSRDLTSAVVFLAGYAVVATLMPVAFDRFRALFAETLLRSPTPAPRWTTPGRRWRRA